MFHLFAPQRPLSGLNCYSPAYSVFALTQFQMTLGPHLLRNKANSHKNASKFRRPLMLASLLSTGTNMVSLLHCPVAPFVKKKTYGMTSSLLLLCELCDDYSKTAYGLPQDLIYTRGTASNQYNNNGRLSKLRIPGYHPACSMPMGT